MFSHLLPGATVLVPLNAADFVPLEPRMTPRRKLLPIGGLEIALFAW
ncbi:MAG: hypothetical protein JSS02_32430 [Planctomycetes bacterium]|nr:hypothetical protein [Planctomycetota bacterium]